jgi:hypothetical protein
MKEVAWALIVYVMVSGERCARPAIDACGACYGWYATYIGELMTWTEFAKKWNTSATYKQKITAAVKVSEDAIKAKFCQFAVNGFKRTRIGVSRSWMGLNMSELKSASGRSYVPERFTSGPNLVLPNARTGEDEQVWLFPDGKNPYRCIQEITESGEETYRCIAEKQHDVWPGCSEEQRVHQQLVRQKKLGTQPVIERVQPIQSFAMWLEKAAVGETVATEMFLNNGVAAGGDGESDAEREHLSMVMGSQDVPQVEGPASSNAIPAAMLGAPTPSPMVSSRVRGLEHMTSPTCVTLSEDLGTFTSPQARAPSSPTAALEVLDSVSVNGDAESDARPFTDT